jgi:hypothetical protein
VVAVTLLAACSGGNGTASPTSSAPRQADLVKAQAALEKSKADLHQVVDNLATTTVQNLRTPFTACGNDIGSATVNRACKTFDEAATCDVGSSEQWPQRWGYNVNVQLVGSDAQLAGTAILKALVAAQWSWQKNGNPSTTGVGDYNFAKDGAAIHVVSDDIPGVLTIEGYGACIVSDGSVRATP